MNQQPDKLFRDKLHGYAKPVSPEAWKQVSENQKRKSRNYIWLKVAASILLIASSGILLFPYLGKEAQPVVTENKTRDTTTKLQAGNNPVTKEDPPAGAEKKPSAPTPSEDKKTKKRERKVPGKNIAPPEKAVIGKPEPADEIVGPSHALQTGIADRQHGRAVNELPESPAKPATRNVTIVFSAEEVDEKYLTKKPVAKATPASEETSTLRKVLDKAYDMKHNQDPLGDLRQKKNEILALNFRGDKQRNEN